MNNLQTRIHEAIGRHYSQAEQLCKDLYAHPEVSMEEKESSRKIVELLSGAGFRVEYPYCGYDYAFRAELPSDGSRPGAGPKVGILVEYDALPGLGHACGHNLHGSLSLLAGLGLSEVKDLFKGTLCIIGTPAEESEGAKAAMAERGAFDGLSAALCMHSSYGGVCQADMDVLSLRNYKVEFRGKAAHVVGMPWGGHSALAAARAFLNLLDARRECFAPGMHVHSIITDGGAAPNIIPEYAAVQTEFRSNAIGTLEVIDGIVKNCGEGAALALDCSVEWKKYGRDYADMLRIPGLEEELERLFREQGFKTIPVQPPIGSSDVGNVSYRCPAVQGLIAITDENYSLHTPEFAACTVKPQAFETMRKGAEILASLAIKIFTDESFRRRINAEFQAGHTER
jgi:amidohydrolase